MAGYHKTNIDKGIIGEISKIEEEVAELIDANEQNNTLLILNELSDIIGSIKLYLEKHHPTIDIKDLIQMADLTEKVFKEGYR